LSVEDAASHSANNAVAAADSSMGRYRGSANSDRAVRTHAASAINTLRAHNGLSVMGIA
jgi:hypothetical protein